MTVSALPAVLDGQQLLSTVGIVGLLVIVFAETGVLLGFFLPGDSLLFAAGYAATGQLTPDPYLAMVILGCVLAAFVGAQVGYLIGRRVGPALLQRPESRWFNPQHVVRAEQAVQR